VVAVNDDRLVLAIGMPAARQALTADGQALADNATFQEAADSLPGGVDMFGNPTAIGALIREAGGGDPSAGQIADVMDKFSYMVSGSDGGDGSWFEFNLGLQE
jgi:hypothetical protein